MFKNKADDGRHNISGLNIAARRKFMRISQRELADRIRAYNIDVTKNAIQRIESGRRFVTDIELKALAEVLGCSVSDLLAGPG